ncbi:MAG: phenylalanine--tRNA ligase subunit beta [Acidimicrobiia bacterium]|nr:phenylalanine--tRNA ligase subunit beta [Acidimicrobiia bacterium]
MKVSLNWLREYIDLPPGVEGELPDVLHSLGHEVESVDVLEPTFTGVVVGRVESIQPHPDADKIRLCRVTTGGEAEDVVCGAWNFEAGAVVPVAVPGAVIGGDFTIGQREIRGVTSNGMICSESELGLGDDHDGILVLDPETPIGTDFRELVDLPDVVFDVTITTNRPDVMSMIGLARELGAYYRLPVKLPETDHPTNDDAPRIAVRIDAPQVGQRFVARELKGISVSPSPVWLQQRLRRCGVRPISNIVDVTNYVMLELGQPLHAFDADEIAGRQIIVRRPVPGETLTTLDGVEHDLDPDDLVVADADRATSLAGVMGGADSEVSDATTAVLIEAAAWDPATVLFMAQRHEIRTEASARFERGVDPNLPPMVTARAARLMIELGGGTASAEVTDVYPTVAEPHTVMLSTSLCDRVLGVTLGAERISELLRLLGLEVAGGPEEFSVTVPTYRRDLARPIDLVEEVARLHGYNNFPETLPSGPAGGLSVAQRRERTLRSLLAGAGLSEAQNFSFHGQAELDKLRLPPDDPRRVSVSVKNPLREEESLMRTTLLPGLLNSARHNVSNGNSDVFLFEIGRVFLSGESSEFEGVPEQPRHLGFIAVGATAPDGVGSQRRPVDAYTATAAWKLVADRMGLDSAILRPAAIPGLHPVRSAEVVLDGAVIGSVGELVPSVAAAFDLEGRVAVGEVMLDPIVADRGRWELQPPSPYPKVKLDLAFDVSDAVTAADLLGAVRNASGVLLESVDVFDEYRGTGLADGRKSLAVRCAFRAQDRTLTDEEIAIIRKDIESAVSDVLDGRLRGGSS